MNAFRTSLLLAASASAAFLAGCSNMVPTATDPDPLSTGTIAGKLHGGNQPISGASVKLYAIGTSGYGSAGTLLATATSANDGYGSFKFSQVTTGATGPSGSAYTCPKSTSQLYLIATGGNTVGTGTVNNTAAAFLAAVGPCSGVASQYVDMNEISTAATVYALAQYINPGSGPGNESIGISSSALAATAYSNALAGIANMASIATGSIVTPPTYAGTGTAAGVTVTATAESSKLITIADALAACVNNASASNSSCTDLFASATPPLAASTTSQPAATFANAQDTVQAAFYLAVNPANNGTFTTCNNGGTTKTACIYGLVTASAPFQPTLATAPTDWTIGVTYTAAGTCTNTGSFLIGPYHAAVDGAGNLWFINGGSATANISEMSPTGTPLTCAGLLSNGRGLTIDVAGNVWGSFNGTATNGIVEIPAGTSTPVVWPITTAAQSYEMTADGFGNVFYNQNATGGSIWEFPNAAGTATPFAPTQIAGPFNGTTATTQGYMQVDSLGRIWDATSTIADLIVAYPKTQSAITAYAVSAGTVTFTGVNTFAIGNVVQVNGLTTAEGTALDNQTYTLTAATGTTFSAPTGASAIAQTTDAGTGTQAATYSSSNLTAAVTSYGIAIDSSNYIYQGTTCCGTAAPYREAVKWTPASPLTASTYTASTPNFAGANGTRSIVVDGASNIFIGNEYPNSAGASATVGTYSIGEYTTSGSGTTATFTSLAPAGTVPTTCSTSLGCASGGGFFDADFLEPLDLQIDPSGNLWVLNSGTAAGTTTGTSITELIGVAVPVVTPLSVAVRNGQLGTKP